MPLACAPLCARPAAADKPLLLPPQKKKHITSHQIPRARPHSYTSPLLYQALSPTRLLCGKDTPRTPVHSRLGRPRGVYAMDEACGRPTAGPLPQPVGPACRTPQGSVPGCFAKAEVHRAVPDSTPPRHGHGLPDGGGPQAEGDARQVGTGACTPAALHPRGSRRTNLPAVCSMRAFVALESLDSCPAGT